MGAAKSGGQEVRVGEVFMECAEKKRFPGFGFFWQGDNCALRGEDGSQRGKCNSQDHKDGGWVYTDGQPGSKMEIPDESLSRVQAVPINPLFLVLVLITIGACRREENVNSDKVAKIAMDAVTLFHAELAQGRYANLCKAAEPTAFSSTTGLSCPEFLAFVHDKLGDALETMRTDRPQVEDPRAGEPVRVELPYATRYQHGLALEHFGWRVGGVQPILYSYTMQSKALSR